MKSNKQQPGKKEDTIKQGTRGSSVKKQTTQSERDQKSKSKPAIEQNETIVKDEKYGEDHIIAKLQKKGFECLSLEEMAVTLISPTFEYEYNLKTGGDWNSNFKSKAVERLNHAKFDINWMNRKTNSAFTLFFDLAAKGDSQKCLEFLRKNANYTEEILNSVDSNLKSPLHVASKNGHSSLVSTLVGKGFSVFARDKFLRTPLHLACQFGYATTVDILIKSGSDIYAKDSCGRNVLHYASSANSIQLMTLLVGQEPELVHSKDNYNRTPLHYVVWNSNPNQIEIAYKILEANAEVDCLDEEGRTPLHYASEAGRGKIIPLLLKFGANVTLRDWRYKKTPLELAPTEHIREIIIVYSGIQYTPKQDDLKFLNNGPNVDKIDSKGIIEEEKKRRGVRQKSQPKNRNLAVIEENKEEFGNNEFIMKAQKDKLFDFLKNIQDYGIKSMQHLSNPSLYSGSWVENINNIEEFYKFINNTDPSEAILKVFNLLFPYSKSFPTGKGEERQMSFFFTKPTKNNHEQNDNNSDDSKNIGGKKENFNKTESQTQLKQDTIDPFVKSEIEKQNQQLMDQKNEIKFLMNEVQIMRNKPSEAEKMLNIELNRYKSENDRLLADNKELKNQIQSLSETISNYKNAIDESKKKELKNNDLIGNLSKQLKELQNEMIKIHNNEKKYIQMNLSNNLGNSIKVSDFNDGKEDFSLDEEKSIYLFIKLIDDKSFGIDQLLLKHDKDNDQYLFKNEFLNILEELNLPIDERAAVVKLAGFTDRKIKMPLKTIIDNFFKREERKFSKLNELLFNICYIMHNNFIDIEKVYSFLKINSEGKLEFHELKQGLDSLDINISDNDFEILFRCLEIDTEKKIKLDDLIDKLKVRKSIIDDIGNLDEKIRFSNNQKLKKITEDEIIIEKNPNENEINDKLNENSFLKENRTNQSKEVSKIDEVDENRENDFENKTIENKFNENSHGNQSNELNEENQDDNVSQTQKYSDNKLNQEEIQEFYNEENSIKLKNENENNEESVKQEDSIKIENEEEIKEQLNTNKDEKFKNLKSSVKNTDEINEEINENDTKKVTLKKKPSATLKKKESVLDKALNGELKIQIKSSKDLIIPKTLKKPYKIYLSLSLEGTNDNKAIDSRPVETSEFNLVVFNWAVRVPLIKKILKEIAVYLKIEVFISSSIGNLPYIKLGESSINWTASTITQNINKWIVNENYQISSKNKKSMGYLSVQLKYIPVGSDESYYDKNGKLLRLPKSIESFIPNKQNANSDIKNYIKNEIKKLRLEIVNIENKHFISNNENYFFALKVNDNNVFSSRDSGFSEIIENLPLVIESEFTYQNDSKIVLCLVEALEENDENVGEIELMSNLDLNGKLELNEKIKLNVVRDDYGLKNKEVQFFINLSIN